MKKKLCFAVVSAPDLLAGLLSGLRGYAINIPNFGPPTTLWLWLSDGQILRLGIDMHDLGGWDEVGTLSFERVGDNEAPEMMKLPASWSSVHEIQKLIYEFDGGEAECGFILSTRSGEHLTVVPGADVYSLAINAPFYLGPFSPENDLTVYRRTSF